LPSDADPVERARLLQRLGLIAEAGIAWQAAFASDTLSQLRFDEGVTFALSQSDDATLQALHREQRARFALPENGSLELAYEARRELAQRLVAVFPGLHLASLGLPGPVDF